MDKHEIRKRATNLYEDEIQYAIARDDEIDLNACRSRAAIRLARWAEGMDISSLWLGYVEGIARGTERAFEVDAKLGQLRVSGALRVGDLTFVPAARARERDWLALDARHETKFREHAAARQQERDFIRTVVDRLREHGGDPTTLQACPDLFPSAEAQAAA